MDMRKPLPHEYPHYYARYINRVRVGEISTTLDEQKEEMRNFLNGLGEEAAQYRYAPGKWSIKEVIGHIIDVERIFVYRALRFARNDKTSLPEFDQEEYIKQANFDSRSLIDLADEFYTVRDATIAMFTHFDETVFNREGIASDQKFTVRSIPFIIAGHESHHREVIEKKYMHR
jgi:uncharacterized damage-inducible protein DinB